MSAKPNYRDSAFDQPFAESAPASLATPRDLAIEPADWDALFEAVASRLRCTVGEDLRHTPDMPAQSAVPTASQIQAVVLDCVGALEQLHAALKQERSQRPTR